MKPNFLFCYLFLMVILGGACGAVPKSLEESISQSPFIFKGTIQSLRSTTVDVDDTNDLMIVKVDEILSSTKEFNFLKGQNITVQVDEIDDYKQNQSQVFIADSWIFGKSIAVRNLGDFEFKEQPGMTEKIKEEIDEVQQQDTLRKLRERIKQADIVFTGEVIEVSELALPDGNGLSEHNPEWKQARIQIKDAMKGISRGQTEVSIAFSDSKDVMWFRAPKFKPKDTGVWILSRKESDASKLISTDNLFVVTDKNEYSADVKTIENVKQIIK